MELRVTQYAIDDVGIATLTLSRPSRGNSWSRRMHEEYRWICKQLDDDPRVRVIVVIGSGNTFSVGADIEALRGYVDGDYGESRSSVEYERPGYGVRPEFDEDFCWQLGMRVPMIAAVNGACAGVAVALAAYCDLRVGITGAKITTATARLGLPAEYGLSWILPRIIGIHHAADLLLTGRIVTAEELGRMGFFNVVVEDEWFFDEVTGYARMIAAASPRSVVAIKRQLTYDMLHNDPRRAVANSVSLMSNMMHDSDYKEGIAALAAHRTPKFG